MQKVERLVNLVVLLLATRRPLTAAEIRAQIPGYREGSQSAFERMFERDKAELRELGLPLAIEPTDVWETEEGYRIRREDAILDDPGLTAEEQAALWIAARAWEGAVAGAKPETGLMKLAAAAGTAGGETASWILPHVEASEPNLEPLMEALGQRRRVRFRYRTGGSGRPAERTVDPYRLLHRGAWYLLGRDHGRGEVRMFKLARIDGAVRVNAREPPFDSPAAGTVAEDLAAPADPEPAGEARVAFAPDGAWWAERRPGARRIRDRTDGSVEIGLPVTDPDRFVSWILGFGPDAVILGPADLRREAIRRLEALA